MLARSQRVDTPGTPDRPTGSEKAKRNVAVPMQAELEEHLGAIIVTYEDGGEIRPGGMCGCCGGGPNVSPDWSPDPWYIYRAGFCDGDGVYYSMLCEGCLEEIREENKHRRETERDEIARQVTALLGDDLDGAQSMMDDRAD